MRILFDNNVPRGLRQFLKGHKTVLSKELGWQSLKNGILIAEAEKEGFEVLITADQNICYQQNLNKRKIAILMLGTNKKKTLLKFVDKILNELNHIKTGQYREIQISSAKTKF